jgi:predicted DNA-binding transcriptional regulator YafY
MTEQVRRATRLVEIERLLRNAPQGLTARQIADRVGYSTRTVQRDLLVLESELGAPLEEAGGGRYKLSSRSTPIGSVRLSLHEARALLLAARAALKNAGERDPDAIIALEKLAAAVPKVIGQQVNAAIDDVRDRPLNERTTGALRALTQAWAESETVTIDYRSQGARATKKTGLDPYLLEPGGTLGSSGIYVIGYSHEHGEVRTFKLDRISKVSPTGRHFVAEEVDVIRRQLGEAWGGVVFGDERVEAVLEFAPEVASRVQESHWHPSQRLTALPDGGLRFEVTLPSLLEFTPWVRSWGPAVRVVAPRELRDEVAAAARQTAALYA